MVVISNDSDTARIWVEQVQPLLDGTPLVMVLSAQAEPMVRPYYGTQDAPVQGIISGIKGGATYELVAGENLGQVYWDPFSVGLIIAVGSILVGGSINVISTLLTRGKTKEGEAR